MSTQQKDVRNTTGDDSAQAAHSRSVAKAANALEIMQKRLLNAETKVREMKKQHAEELKRLTIALKGVDTNPETICRFTDEVASAAAEGAARRATDERVAEAEGRLAEAAAECESLRRRVEAAAVASAESEKAMRRAADEHVAEAEKAARRAADERLAEAEGRLAEAVVECESLRRRVEAAESEGVSAESEKAARRAADERVAEAEGKLAEAAAECESLRRRVEAAESEGVSAESEKAMRRAVDEVEGRLADAATRHALVEGNLIAADIESMTSLTDPRFEYSTHVSSHVQLSEGAIFRVYHMLERNSSGIRLQSCFGISEVEASRSRSISFDALRSASEVFVDQFVLRFIDDSSSNLSLSHMLPCLAPNIYFFNYLLDSFVDDLCKNVCHFPLGPHEILKGICNHPLSSSRDLSMNVVPIYLIHDHENSRKDSLVDGVISPLHKSTAEGMIYSVHGKNTSEMESTHLSNWRLRNIIGNESSIATRNFSIDSVDRLSMKSLFIHRITNFIVVIATISRVVYREWVYRTLHSCAWKNFFQILLRGRLIRILGCFLRFVIGSFYVLDSSIMRGHPGVEKFSASKCIRRSFLNVLDVILLATNFVSVFGSLTQSGEFFVDSDNSSPYHGIILLCDLYTISRAITVEYAYALPRRKTSKLNTPLFICFTIFILKSLRTMQSSQGHNAIMNGNIHLFDCQTTIIPLSAQTTHLYSSTTSLDIESEDNEASTEILIDVLENFEVDSIGEPAEGLDRVTDEYERTLNVKKIDDAGYSRRNGRFRSLWTII